MAGSLVAPESAAPPYDLASLCFLICSSGACSCRKGRLLSALCALAANRSSLLDTGNQDPRTEHTPCPGLYGCTFLVLMY